MILRNKIIKNLYQFHRYAGVIIAIHFAIFALTGLPLLFQTEIQSIGEDAAPASETLTNLAQPNDYEKIMTSAMSMHAGSRPLAIFPDEKDANTVQVRLGPNGAKEFRGAIKLAYDRIDLNEKKPVESHDSGFFGWLLTLHRELFLGSFGKIYIGVVGLIYALMLISGFLIYGKFMKGRRFAEVRTHTRTQRYRDLHRFIGMITFGWGLVVAISGSFLAFNGLLLKFYQYQGLNQLKLDYPARSSLSDSSAKLSKIMSAVIEARPQSNISYIAFPDTQFSIPNHYLVLIHGNDAISSRISEIAVVQASTAKVVQVLELPLYLKMAVLSEPLHFGNYGGLPLKIMWACFTLLSLIVMILGVSTFFLKRRKTIEARISEPLSTLEPKPYRGSHYLFPAVFTAVTLAGIVAALFQRGWAAKPVVALAGLPLLIFAVMMIKKRRVNA